LLLFHCLHSALWNFYLITYIIRNSASSCGVGGCFLLFPKVACDAVCQLLAGSLTRSFSLAYQAVKAICVV